MVYVGDKKYACETCIKGHRSSSCKHTDRPLFEIKKKGRPVTQCEHCRELRKTRQVHVKCVCESKDGFPEATGIAGQGGTKVSGRAAFPSGLPPELLEASVMSRPLSEGSDSDHSGRGCTCKDDASCTCWAPRQRGKQPASRAADPKTSAIIHGDPVSEPAALVINAHAGHKRPVLPKPPAERPMSPPRSGLVSPSAQSSGRSSSHSQSSNSPYGRAYDYSRGGGPPYDNQAQAVSRYPTSVPGYIPSGVAELSQRPGGPFGGWQQEGSQSLLPLSPNSPLCNCGATCACPGCLEHNGPNVDPSASCANPDTCSACLECSMISLASWTSEVAQPFYTQNADDWLRQLSVMPDFIGTSFNSGHPLSGVSSSQSDIRLDPGIVSAYGAWSDSRTGQAAQPIPSNDCCGGRCKCPSGMCGCPPDCCGCCQGCTCSSCSHGDGSGRTLTFATSGERAPCCGGVTRTEDRHSISSASAPGTSHLTASVFPATSRDPSSVSPPPRANANASQSTKSSPGTQSCCAPLTRPVSATCIPSASPTTREGGSALSSSQLDTYADYSRQPHGYHRYG